jgi:hypothetical protein
MGGVTGLQIPHIQGGFLFLPCPVLHRTALALRPAARYTPLGKGVRFVFGSALLLRTHHQNGAVSKSDDRVRDTAHQCPLQGSKSTAPHNY